MKKEIDDRATCYDCANGFNGRKKTNVACGHVYKKEPIKAPFYKQKSKNQLIAEAP